MRRKTGERLVTGIFSKSRQASLVDSLIRAVQWFKKIDSRVDIGR